MQVVRRKTLKVDPADPQRDAVYTWEIAHESWNVCTLDLDQCNHVLEKALKFYGCDPVHLEQGSPARYSWNMPEWRWVKMQGPSRRGRGGMNVATVLHEATHQIIWDLYPDNVQDHGPTFLGVYRDLLLAAKVLTAREFDVSARHYKLKWRRDL